jgi:hypothetical protein
MARDPLTPGNQRLAREAASGGPPDKRGANFHVGCAVMTPDDIDQAILAQCREQWLKVARVLAFTVNALENSITDEAAADRLATLVAAGRLEARGDIAKWRHSEVRLAPT